MDLNGDGTIDSTIQNPTFTYNSIGLYSVSLTVTNAASATATLTKTNYIGASTPPATVSFTGTPLSGNAPLTVQFTDTSTGSPTVWQWDFQNDGVVDSTAQNPAFMYTIAGTYAVKLTVTNAGGPSSLVKPNYVSVTVPTCVVPNFINTSSSNAQTTWSGAGFTTTVNFQQGGLPWIIKSQNVVAGSSVFCTSNITVSKN